MAGFTFPKTLVVLATLAASTTAVMAQNASPPRFDFAAMDTDKDGNVTKVEVEAFELAQITAMDTNADGKISADEMMAHHSAMMQAALEARAKDMSTKMIERLDTDKDGALSIAEMSARKGSVRMFDRLDDNSDGMISQAEMDAAQAAMDKRGGRRGDHHGSHAGGGFWGKFKN